jgi:ParB/RepB/Spo0J family partition protein
MESILTLELDQILPPLMYLRPVRPDTVEFLEMVDSLRERGLLNSILVRPTPDVNTFQLVDGAWRLAAAKVAGLERLEAICRDISDEDVYACQIAANAIGKITEPVEFASHIERLRRAGDTEMSMNMLAAKIKKSPPWIKNMLGLLNLNRVIQEDVNSGIIPLGSAYILSRLTPRLQSQLSNEAKVKTVKDFKTIAARVLNNYRVQVKMGKVTQALDTRAQILAGKAFSLQRKILTVEEELKNHSLGGSIVAAEGCKSALDGFYAGLKWTLHIDKMSLAQRIADEKSKDDKVESNRIKRKEDRNEMRNRVDTDTDLD